MQNTVKFVNQPYDKPGDLQNLLHYAMTDKQTGTWCEYTGGINTAPLYALDEMMYVKKFFRKTEGRQLRHIIVSPDTQYYFRLTPQDLYFLALRIGTYVRLSLFPSGLVECPGIMRERTAGRETTQRFCKLYRRIP